MVFKPFGLVKGMVFKPDQNIMAWKPYPLSDQMAWKPLYPLQWHIPVLPIDIWEYPLGGGDQITALAFQNQGILHISFCLWQQPSYRTCTMPFPLEHNLPMAIHRIRIPPLFWMSLQSPCTSHTKHMQPSKLGIICDNLVKKQTAYNVPYIYPFLKMFYNNETSI